MTKEKHYNYKRPTNTWFYQFTLLTIIGLYGYIMFREIIRLLINFNDKRFVLLLVVTLTISFILYIHYQIIKMYKEYDVIERNKEIVVNNEERKITIRQDASEITVRNENLESAEIFESWAATFPLGYFKFIKLRTKTGENLTITEFTVPLIESELNSVLKGIKLKRERRFFNRIK